MTYDTDKNYAQKVLWGLPLISYQETQAIVEDDWNALFDYSKENGAKGVRKTITTYISDLEEDLQYLVLRLEFNQ